MVCPGGWLPGLGKDSWTPFISIIFLASTSTVVVETLSSNPGSSPTTTTPGALNAATARLKLQMNGSTS